MIDTIWDSLESRAKLFNKESIRFKVEDWEYLIQKIETKIDHLRIDLDYCKKKKEEFESVDKQVYGYGYIN